MRYLTIEIPVRLWQRVDGSVPRGMRPVLASFANRPHMAATIRQTRGGVECGQVGVMLGRMGRTIHRRAALGLHGVNPGRRLR